MLSAHLLPPGPPHRGAAPWARRGGPRAPASVSSQVLLPLQTYGPSPSGHGGGGGGALLVAPSCTSVVADEEPPEPSCSGTPRALADELGIEAEQALWFSVHRPELLHRPPERLRRRLAGLADLLGCTPKQVANMIRQQPELIDADAAGIRARLQELTDALGDLRGARASARRMPMLLLGAGGRGAAMHTQLAALADLLHATSVEAAVRVAVKEPMLLVMDPADMATRLAHVSRCFRHVDASLQVTAERAARHPWLLTVSSASLSSKLRALGASLHISPSSCQELAAAYPAILNQSAANLHSKVEMLLESIPRSSLQAMVFRQPSLLCRSVAKILASLQSLREVTSMSRGDVVDVVEKRPGILTRSTLAPGRCYRALSIWRLSQSEKRQLIKAHPLLLQLSPREVHFRCRWLRALMESNGFFHSALRRLPPSLLGALILHLPCAWCRLQYLAESNQEGSVSLTETLSMNNSAFGRHFPEFRMWLQYKTSAMGASVPWRVPRRRQGQTLLEAAVSERLQRSEPTQPSSDAAASGSGSFDETDVPLTASVVSEAQVVYYGTQRVNRPRRVVFASTGEGVALPEAAGSDTAHDHPDGAPAPPAELLSAVDAVALAATQRAEAAHHQQPRPEAHVQPRGAV